MVTHARLCFHSWQVPELLACGRGNVQLELTQPVFRGACAGLPAHPLPARSCVPHDLCPHTLYSHLLLTPLWPHLTLSCSRTACACLECSSPAPYTTAALTSRCHLSGMSPTSTLSLYSTLCPVSFIALLLICSHLTYSCVCLCGICLSRWIRGLVYVIFACMFSAWARVQHIVGMGKEKKKNEWT